LQSEIHKLINYVWNKKECPHLWKESIIEPIYNKGDITDSSKYRVISLLSNSYKILNFNILCTSILRIMILIPPCSTQSKSDRFRCFFFLIYFTACFGISGHHPVYKVCVRNLLCFPFDVLEASRCFIQVMLRNAFEFNHVFGSYFLNMVLSFSLVLYLLCVQVNRVKYTEKGHNQTERIQHQWK
jgi:hypothetical protein